MTLDEVVKNYVLLTLSRNSKLETCRILGITRRTLYNYIKAWGREDLLGKNSFLINQERIDEMRNLEAWERDFIENSDFLRRLPERKPRQA